MMWNSSLCLCLSLVSALVVLPLRADDNVSAKGKEIIQHFRDYAHNIKGLKISTQSFDVAETDKSEWLCYDAVFDFARKRRKFLSYGNGDKEQSFTEELFDEGDSTVLYYKKEIETPYDVGVRLVLQNISENQWSNAVCLQFLGYIFFDISEFSRVSFWDVVDGMQIQDVREKQLEDGVNIVTVILSSKKQKVELSLIPSKQWVPYAITWTQEPFSSSIPCTRQTKIRYSDHQLLSNCWVPRSFITEMSFSSATLIGPDGKEFKIPSQTLKSRVDINAITINPSLNDEDFSFSIPIPDHTPVLVEDVTKSHIKHVWIKGKVVPWTDETALAYAKGHKFMPGPDEPRFWMMAVGIFLIVLSCSIKAYQYFKSRKAL